MKQVIFDRIAFVLQNAFSVVFPEKTPNAATWLQNELEEICSSDECRRDWRTPDMLARTIAYDAAEFMKHISKIYYKGSISTPAWHVVYNPLDEYLGDASFSLIDEGAEDMARRAYLLYLDWREEGVWACVEQDQKENPEYWGNNPEASAAWVDSMLREAKIDAIVWASEHSPLTYEKVRKIIFA